MKTAFPVNEGLIERKLDEAHTIAVFDINDGRIEGRYDIQIEDGDDIAEVLVSSLVNEIIVIGISPELMIALALHDIKITGGHPGKVEDILNEYMKGELFGDDVKLDCGGAGCSGDCSKCH